MVAGNRRPQVDETDGIRVFDEWTEEVDLSLDPETGRFLKRTHHPTPREEQPMSWPLWAGLGIAASALFGSIGAAVAVVALIAGAGGMALALLLFAPTVDVVLPSPTAPSVATETPLVPAQPTTKNTANTASKTASPKKASPKIAPTPGAADPAPAEVEAQLVVMPDPGFRGKPLGPSIDELNKKANLGKIGVVAGH